MFKAYSRSEFYRHLEFSSFPILMSSFGLPGRHGVVVRQKMALPQIIYGKALSWMGILVLKLTHIFGDSLWSYSQHAKSVMARVSVNTNH